MMKMKKEKKKTRSIKHIVEIVITIPHIIAFVPRIGFFFPFPFSSSPIEYTKQGHHHNYQIQTETILT